MFLHTKKALSLLAILIPAAALWAQSSSGELPRPATMEQCVQYAIEHNISINQAQMNTELAKVDKTDAIGAFLPSAGLSSNYNFSKGFSFDANTKQRTNREQQTMSLSVSTQLNLFNGLKDLNNLRRARLEYASQRYNSEKILNDVSLNVVSAYISILAALEYQKVAQSQYELSKMQVERLETLYKAGKNSLGDLYEVQATLARDEQALVAANNQVDLAYLSLKQLLALDLTYDLQIDTLGYDQVSLSPLMSTSTVEIYRSAEANLPEMRKARNDIEVSRRSLAIARGSYLPTLSASYGWGDSFIFDYLNPSTGAPITVGEQWDNNSRHSIGVSLSIPIFNRLSTYNAVSRSKINLEVARLNLQQAQLELQQSVEKAYSDAVSSYKSYLAAVKAVESSREALRYATEKFEVGKISSFDYETAKNLLLKSQGDMLSAKYDYLFKVKLLEFYQTQKITY